jgi:hypothetical protein
MFKFLILAGGVYLVYKAIKNTIGGLFGSAPDAEVKRGEAKDEVSSYSDDDVIDVTYREISPDDQEDEDK